MADISWLHRYAPKSFGEVQLVIPEEERLQFLEISEGRAKENIILAGTPGTGKSSIAHLLLKKAINPLIIHCPQYKGDKHWQSGGIGYLQMMGSGDAISEFYHSKAELRKKTIRRLVLLEEFDEINNQSVFKTLLDENTARDSVCVLTTNHFGEIDEAIKSRCAVYQFGRESELWMNYEDDKPSGCREQITSDLMGLMYRVLKAETKKSFREAGALDSDDTIQFFKNIIHQNYPSVRECLTKARRFIRKGELIIPARFLKPIEE